MITELLEHPKTRKRLKLRTKTREPTEQELLEQAIKDHPYITSNADAGSMKAYIARYFSDFPMPISNPELRKTLVEILHQAFFTTFIDDYDFNERGIGLEKLTPFPKETVDICLGCLERKGNMFVTGYVKDYRAKYRQNQESN